MKPPERQPEPLGVRGAVVTNRRVLHSVRFDNTMFQDSEGAFRTFDRRLFANPAGGAQVVLPPSGSLLFATRLGGWTQPIYDILCSM